MSRSPRSDIRSDTEVTVQCNSLVDHSEILSLSLFQNGDLVKEVKATPFRIDYKLLYTKEKGLSLYECVLKPKYYDELSQTRTIDFICELFVVVKEETDVHPFVCHIYCRDVFLV